MPLKKKSTDKHEIWKNQCFSESGKSFWALEKRKSREISAFYEPKKENKH